MVFNTGPYTVLPDNSILITANVQSETGFPSSHQLKSYVSSKSRLKLAARAVLSADAGLLVKILKGCENINRKVFFGMSKSSLRGHSLELNKKRVRLDVAKFSFSNRVVNEWNILDEEIISGCSLAGFKRKLDRHLRDKGGYI